jgi:hypothetical protein
MKVWIVYTIDRECSVFSEIHGVYKRKEDAEKKAKEVSGRWWESTYTEEWEVE